MAEETHCHHSRRRASARKSFRGRVIWRVFATLTDGIQLQHFAGAVNSCATGFAPKVALAMLPET